MSNRSEIKAATYLAITLFLLLPTAIFAQRPINQVELTTSQADTSTQRDLIDVGRKLFGIKTDKGLDSVGGRKVYFSFLPFSTQVPGGGTALITSTTAGFYLGNRETTNLSRVTFTPYWNFGKRFGLPVRSFVWLNDNEWVIMGDTRILRYPQYTWGLGRHHSEEDKLLLNYNYLRFYQHPLKKITDGIFVGLGYDLDYRMNVELDAEDRRLYEFTDYPYGTSPGDHTVSSGLSLNVLFDTRTNSINPLDGCYAELQYRVNKRFLGSDHPWNSLYVDLRRYCRFTDDINKQNMLAVWAYYWTVFSEAVPYLDLPSIGWDGFNRSGRGFDQNRYRGRSLMYLEAEYRRDITHDGLFGFVLFSNANSVKGPNSDFLRSWNFAVGGGLRIKFNKRAGTNIALDLGKSRDFTGFQLSLGEVF